MRDYEIKFTVYGKGFKTTVSAESEAQAKQLVVVAIVKNLEYVSIQQTRKRPSSADVDRLVNMIFGK